LLVCTAAVHIGDIPLGASFSSNTLLVKVTNIELWDITWLMSYRDTNWYIRDSWLGFSTRNIANHAVVHHTFMASRVIGSQDGQIVAFSLWVA